MTNVDLYAEAYTAKQQARKAAGEQVRFSLDELINPSEVVEGAETWEEIDIDRLREEVGEGIDVMVYEGQIPAIEDLAIVLWRENLPRVPMRHLVFETHREAVRNGYWPYDMNRMEVTDELLEYADEYEYFHEYVDKAEDELYSSIASAYHPTD